MTQFSKHEVINNLRREKNKLEAKLKAIKKFVEKGPLLHVDTLADCQQSVDDWLGKLMNILEAEK